MNEVTNLFKLLSRNIEGAKRLEDVQLMLQFARAVCLSRPASHLAQQLQQLQQHAGTLHQNVILAVQSVQIKLVQDALEVLSHVWSAFDVLSDVLLSVVALDWLPVLPVDQQRTLFDDFYLAAPAPIALSALVSHLSQVTPGAGSEDSSSGALVMAVAAETAADLLVRLLLPGGVQKLLGSQQAGAGAVVDLEDMAGLLVSIPDRAARLHPDLQQGCFYTALLNQTLQLLLQPWPLPASNMTPQPSLGDGAAPTADGPEETAQGDGMAPAGQPVNGPVLQLPLRPPVAQVLEFGSILLQRMCKRGGAAAAAKALAAAAVAAVQPAGSEVHAAAASAVPAEGGGLDGATAGTWSHVQQLVMDACEDDAAAEKLLEGLVLQLARQPDTSLALAALGQLLPVEALCQPSVRYVLYERLLLHKTLPAAALQLLLRLLAVHQPTSSAEVVGSLARAWSDAASVQRTRLPLQAYWTLGLELALQELTRADIEGCPGLLPLLLEGVSTRLGSPLPSVRRQAMRVGRALSLRLDPSQPLFSDMGSLELMAEELWPGAVPVAVPADEQDEAAEATARAPPAASQARAVAAQSAADHRRAQEPSQRLDPDEPLMPWGQTRQDGDPEGVGATGWGAVAAAAADRDLGDLEEVSDSDDSLEPYDLEDEEGEADWMAADRLGQEPGAKTEGLSLGKPLQLRSLAAALRKGDNVHAVLAAVGKAEALLRAAPEELRVHAGDLATALLHCRPPEWAETEAAHTDQRPEVQRLRALAALAAVAPQEGGMALAGELYSPHLDTHQRLLILDALATASHELADPRTAPRLEAGKGAPRVVGPGRQDEGVPLALDAAARSKPAETSGQQPPALRAGRSRVWGKVSLQKQREAAAAPKPFRNAFADVALTWTVTLLKGCDVRQHGVDLFGRDALLLGRLIVLLGTFAECSTSTPAAAPLTLAITELLRSPQVHSHPEPFVRRSALLAAAQVVSSLPPARLAGAVEGVAAGNAGEAALLERLQWLHTWMTSTARDDPDANCRLLAAGAAGMQAQLAAGAATALQAAPQAPQYMRTTKLIIPQSPGLRL